MRKTRTRTISLGSTRVTITKQYNKPDSIFVKTDRQSRLKLEINGGMPEPEPDPKESLGSMYERAISRMKEAFPNMDFSKTSVESPPPSSKPS